VAITTALFVNSVFAPSAEYKFKFLHLVQYELTIRMCVRLKNEKGRAGIKLQN